MKRRRIRLTIHNQEAKEMINLCSDGVPRYVVAKDYGVCERTLRRLIAQHEQVNGTLVVSEKKSKQKQL